MEYLDILLLKVFTFTRADEIKLTNVVKHHKVTVSIKGENYEIYQCCDRDDIGTERETPFLLAYVYHAEYHIGIWHLMTVK